MVKDAPDHIPMNIIDFANTSCKIFKDDDILTSPVVLINPKALWLMFKPQTAPNRDYITRLLRGDQYNLYMNV